MTVDTTTGEHKVKVLESLKHTVGTYKFTVTYTARGGLSKTSSELTLNVICGPKSTTVTLPKIDTEHTYNLIYND